MDVKNRNKKGNQNTHLDSETQLLYAMRSLENNPDGVFWCDIFGNICYVNKAASEKLGYSQEQLLNMNIVDIDPNITRDMLTLDSAFTQKNINGNVTHLQTAHRHHDGDLIPVDIAILSLETEGNSLGCSFVRDISKRIESENQLKAANAKLERQNSELQQLYLDLSARETQLEFLAYHDSLTGLPNRTMVNQRLAEIAKNHCNHLETLSAVFFVDIDNFKNINDTLGHRFGDKLLIEAAKRFTDNIDPDDFVARLGGDEFIVVIQNIQSLKEIKSYSQRISNCLISPMEIEGISIFLTCSIGVSILPLDSISPEELLKYADTAMYQAKNNGKNTIQFFNNQMKEELMRKVDIEYKLRNGILNGELALHYQPQYELNSGKIRGIEALLRWENCILGEVDPDIFIPIAEETGLIMPIGEWVLKEACSAVSRWQKLFAFDGIIAVNISALQLRHINFVQTVRNILGETGLDPDRLELEINESTFIHSFELAESALCELFNLGVRISMDDFGKCYSSLAYLKQLKIHTLKIDKTFIDEINQDTKENKSVNAMISLVQNLGAETIAEGIENMEQFQYLQGSGIDNVQGHLFSTPIPEKRLIEIIGNHNQVTIFSD